jgi:hypothetical protein
MQQTLLVEIASDTLEKTSQAVALTGDPARSPQLHDFLTVCKVIAATVAGFLDATRAVLNKGAELRGLKRSVGRFVEVAERSLSLFEGIRSAARGRVEAGDEDARTLQRLTQAIGEIRRGHAELVRIADWLNSPFPKVEDIPPATDPPEEYEGLDSVLGRLDRGGDL